VECRHRAGLDPACETVADDQVVAVTQALDKCVELGEVVTLVGVTHDHKLTLRGDDPTGNSGSVTSGLDMHDASPFGGRNVH
jgi:hypothetical protein